MVKSEGEGGGLCSWLINTIEEGLNGGISGFIGDNSTGRLLNGITSHSGDSGAGAQFTQISNQLTTITAQLSTIQGQLTHLLSVLNLDVAKILSNEDQDALTSYYSDIQSAYSASSSSYTYLAKQAQGTDLTDPTAVSTLKNGAVAYNKTFTTAMMSKDLAGLYDFIVSNKMLHKYATQIILQNSPGTATLSAADATASAENGYQLLQQKFSEVLNYQIQALIIMVDLDNYNDPTGKKAQYDINIFQGYLKEEIAQFLMEVNYLMLNMVDYRNTGNYTKDSGSMYTHGLVSDDTYNMIFATSRAFCAQLVNSFQPDFGFHGSIVVPNYYAPVAIPTPAPPTSPVTTRPVTFTLTPYTTGSNGTRIYAADGAVTITAQPSPSTSQFPYTAWNTKNHSFPDNNWLFYEFTAPSDLPAGNYAITLVDNGKASTPWNHSTTDFGTVSVLYYDPTNFSAGGTLSPTATNTFKFGSMSGRWNWGYHALSMNPMSAWQVPAKQTIKTSNTTGESSTFTDVNPEMSNLPKGYSYYPQSNFTAGVHALGLNLPSSTENVPMMAYTIQLSFTAGPVPSGFTGTPQLYYNNTATVNFNVSDSRSMSNVYFDYNLIDTSKSKTVSIAKYANTSHSINNASVPQSGIVSAALVSADTYQISVDAALNSYNYSKTTTSGNIDLNWDMQVVYSDLLFDLPS